MALLFGRYRLRSVLVFGSACIWRQRPISACIDQKAVPYAYHMHILSSLFQHDNAYSKQFSNPVSGGQCRLNHLTILRRFSWASLSNVCTFQFYLFQFFFLCGWFSLLAVRMERSIDDWVVRLVIGIISQGACFASHLIKYINIHLSRACWVNDHDE